VLVGTIDRGRGAIFEVIPFTAEAARRIGCARGGELLSELPDSSELDSSDSESSSELDDVDDDDDVSLLSSELEGNATLVATLTSDRLADAAGVTLRDLRGDTDSTFHNPSVVVARVYPQLTDRREVCAYSTTPEDLESL
jgi:hypothetical protein